MNAVTRPLLLLIPPLETLGAGADAGVRLAGLVAWVSACRRAGRDVRLRLSRGRTAAEECEAARADGVDVAVVVLAAADECERSVDAADAVTLLAALRARAVPLASESVIAAGAEAQLQVVADRASVLCGPASTGVDASVPAPVVSALPCLRAHADACLRRAHVSLAAEMFAGNHLARRNADLTVNLVP